VDFTTFTWPALLKRLRQMLITGTRRRRGRAGWLHGLYATR
jgi:hypothetical protein